MRVTFNTLRIAKMFIDSTAKQWCCYDFEKQLKMPRMTVHHVLITMKELAWLTSQGEETSRQRVLYRITPVGIEAVRNALTALQLQTPST